MKSMKQILIEITVDQALKVLGLSQSDARDANKLKQAYKSAAVKTHPDKGGRMLGFINWLAEQRQSFYIHNNAYKNGELVKCEEGDEFYKFLLNQRSN